jgi:CcmD family protein
MRGRFSRRLQAALAAASLWLWPLVAAAQEWQKVEGKASEEIPAVSFVGYAYGFIWIAVVAYVVYVARGLGKVNAELEQLRRKLDGGAAGPSQGQTGRR